MKTRGNPSGPEISKDLAKGRIYGRNCASAPADIETKNACKPEESIYGFRHHDIPTAKTVFSIHAHPGQLPRFKETPTPDLPSFAYLSGLAPCQNASHEPITQNRPSRVIPTQFIDSNGLD